MIKAVIFDMYETLITHYHGGPLYFSTQIAQDIGAPVTRFQTMWRALETERSIGVMSLEDTLEYILKKNQCYSKEAVRRVVDKRIEIAEACFRNLHEEIIPMLSRLKEQGIKIGLISNCFSDEAKVIRKSALAAYFDVICLSYEEGVQKPDVEIFKRCVEGLLVTPEECLYVGDGGSRELEAAKEFGMKTAQACWYFKEELGQNVRRKKAFQQMNFPLDIMELVFR